MGQVRQRGEVWWIRYCRNGVRHEESSHSAKKQAAIDLLKIREGDSARGVPVTAEMGRLRFEAAAKDVLNDYIINRRRSLGHAERRLRLHLIPFLGGCRMTAITTDLIREYIISRQTEHAKNATINRELAIIKRAFHVAIGASKLMMCPAIPMLDEHNVRSGFFEPEQFAAVYARLPEDLQPVMQFAYLTGWRVPSEILPLQWRQVDFTSGTVRLDPGTTKNDEGRVFPFDVLPDLLALLELQQRRRVQLCPSVFHRDGKPIKDFRDAWKTACEGAGWPAMIPHDFRRTAVRNLVRAGVPEKAAMLLTGHKTRSVFDRYHIVNEADLREAVRKLGAVATGTKVGQSAQSGRIARFKKRP
jgi:integrase